MRQNLEDTDRSYFNVCIFFLKFDTAQFLLKIFAMYSITKAL